MTARLGAIGIASGLPVRAQTEIARDAIEGGSFTEKQAERLVRVYERSGIARRGAVIHDERLSGGAPMGFLPSATSEGDRGPSTGARMEAYERCAPGLAVRSAREAIDQAGVDVGSITHLVTVSCTGNTSPGVDHAIIESLGLPRSVARTNVGFMGCHGALNGLRVARAFVEADPGARVLLSCVELCSLHYQYGWETEKVIANALFADGSASAIVDATTSGAPRIVDCASFVIPDSQSEMSWRVRDHGFEMTLTRRVPTLIEEHAGAWVSGWLRAHGLGVEDIHGWAIHPGGPKILSAVQRALDLSDDDMWPSRKVLEENGNMSSPTVLVILNELRERSIEPPHVAIAFGPGLSIEAALLRS